MAAGLPDRSTDKEAVDYFLKWMENNLETDTEVATGKTSISSMRGLLDHYYIYSNESCVVSKKAITSGSAKVLAALCNRAGVESHVVLGTWESGGSSNNGYALTYVKIHGEDIFVDAAGGYASKLGNQRYMNETEVKNHMTFITCLNYK